MSFKKSHSGLVRNNGTSLFGQKLCVSAFLKSKIPILLPRVSWLRLPASCLLGPISAFFVSIVFHLCLLSLITCFSYLFSIVLIIPKPIMPYKNGFSVLFKKKIWHIFSWGASHQKLSSARSHVIELIVCTVSIAPFPLRLKDDRGLMTTKFQKNFSLHR